MTAISNSIGKVLPGRIVLRYYATAAFAFFLLSIIMLLTPEAFEGPFFHPHLLSIVHLAALGWGTMIIFGAAYQLIPVIFEQDLFSPQLAAVSWYPLTFGVIMLTGSFWNFTVGWIMITGGCLAVISVLIYTVNVLITASRSTSSSVQKSYFISSSLWLLFTTIVGLLVVIHFKFPFIVRNHLDVLKLHAHAGLVGWFLQLIIGASSKLVPMFLLGKSSKEKLLWVALMLQNGGLMLFLIDGFLWGFTYRIIIYAIIVAIGIATWLFYLADCYRHAIRKQVDVQMKHTFISFCALIAALVLIPSVYFGAYSQVSILYGSLLFMGWITGIILGKTFKTLPFMVWNDHYKHLTGKTALPLPKDLYSENLLRGQFYTFIVALLSLSIGITLQNRWTIKIALLLWLVVALLYVINVFKILTHKVKV